MTLEIVNIDVLESAVAGETVNVTVTVKNNSTTERIFSIVKGAVNSTTLESGSHYILANSQRAFGLSFLMPNHDVELEVSAYQWDWDTGDWSSTPDDTSTATVTWRYLDEGEGVAPGMTEIMVIVFMMMFLGMMMMSIPRLTEGGK